MAYAALKELDSGNVLGRFINAETRAVFEYGVVGDLPFGPEYRCAVWLSDGSFRYAKVLRTVAYVVVDEDECGGPVVERWEIRQHKEYVL